MAGKIITLEVKDSDTIEAVKSKIEDKESIPPDEQRLFLAGQELQDHHTLGFYGMKNLTTLVCVRRGYMVVFVRTPAGGWLLSLFQPW